MAQDAIYGGNITGWHTGAWDFSTLVNRLYGPDMILNSISNLYDSSSYGKDKVEMNGLELKAEY